MTRLLFVVAIAASVACHSTSRTPSAPDVVTRTSTKLKPFGGVWVGQYRITSTLGGGPGPATLVPFTLRLEQTGAVLRGSFQTNSVMIDVTGTMDDNFVMLLEGSAPGLGRVDFVGAATLTRFHAHVDAAGGLAGDLEYRLDRTAETPLGFRTVFTADIASARRIDTSLPSTFDGTWVGRFIVRACTGTCLPPHVGELGGFTLNLRQTGSSVAGDISFTLSDPPLPVSGHVDGGHLVLDASTTAGRFRILEWSTERDGYGRMIGSFSYEQSGGIRREVELGPAWLVP